MIRKLIGLIVPARLSEEVTAKRLDESSSALLLNSEVDCIIRGDWQVFVRVEAADFRPNVRAAQLLHETGLHLPEVAGRAIFLGRTELGWDTDTPAHLLNLAEKLFDASFEAAELV